MKTSLKCLFATAVLSVLALPVVSIAQDNPPAPPADGSAPPPPRGGGRGRMMSPADRLKQLDTALTLSDDQKTKILALLTKQQDAMRDIAPEDRQAKMRAMNKETNDGIEALLTDEQKTKFAAMPKGPPGGRGPGAGGPPPK